MDTIIPTTPTSPTSPTSPTTPTSPTSPPTTGSGVNINDINNQGWIETINSMTISGWAAKGKMPSAVDIYIDDVKYTVNPTLVRPDVAIMLNTTNQNFGWSFDILQTSVNTSKGKHQVTVYFAGSQMQLSSNLPPFYVITDPIVPTPTPPPTPTGGGGKNILVSDLINKKSDTISPKNLKPILIGLGIVILGLVAYKILKKK
jgi:hypothetical protein